VAGILAGASCIDDYDGLGTAALKDTGTSGNTVPLLDASNTFTGYQQINITQDFGSALILQSTQDSANEGPFLQFKRVSASPADNDRLGAFSFAGRNTALAERTLAQFGVYLTNATEATLASLMVFKTYFSGTFTDRFYLKGAFYAAGTADTGVGTINATTLYESGTSLASKYSALASSNTFTGSTTQTSAQFRASGDTGGAASTNTLTATSDLTANSTGVGTILFKGTTSRNSAGFIKIYVGTTAYYIPVFSDITG
jgi:hypothetical protein